MSTETNNPQSSSNKTGSTVFPSPYFFGKWLRFSYIPRKGLENLKNYKYSGKDLSVVATYILQPFWRWLAELLPDWLAYVFLHRVHQLVVVKTRERESESLITTYCF
jgi:hypothetical protein